MPIDFGKNVNRKIPGTADNGVLAELLSGTEEQVLRRHQRQQMDRMARPRAAATMRESERTQVYIYNVGPFSRTLSTLGSQGRVYIPGLPEKQVLQDMAVAGPYIVPGSPAEPFPGEPRGQWLEHEPQEFLRWKEADGEEFLMRERPGIDLALRIIGGHEQSPKNSYAATPFEQGCFVSTVPRQSEPEEPKEPAAGAAKGVRREYERALVQHEERQASYLKWVANWEAARDRFTSWAMRRGEEQCLAFSNGKYERDEELFVLARIFQKTEKDWNFLAGSVATVKTKRCWSCHRMIDSDAPKCQCGELQISEAEYKKRREAVLAGV